MSPATLREARSRRKAFDSEIQYYKQEVTRITSGSALRIEFDKLETYQQELRALDKQCYSWKRKVTGLKSKLSKKDDRSQYKEAMSLIRAFDYQSGLMNQLRDFFALAANAAGEAEQQAKRRAKKVTAALNDALKAIAGIVGGSAKQTADSLSSAFKAVTDKLQDVANNAAEVSLWEDLNIFGNADKELSDEEVQRVMDHYQITEFSLEEIKEILIFMQTQTTCNSGGIAAIDMEADDGFLKALACFIALLDPETEEYVAFQATRRVYPVQSSTNGTTYEGHGDSLDFAAAVGADLVAATSGTVIEIVQGYPDDYLVRKDAHGNWIQVDYNTKNPILDENGNTITGAPYGNYVKIQAADGTEILYAHMSYSDASLVQVGDTITAGTLIGAVGETGHTYGAHLHFEVKNTPSGKSVHDYLPQG